MKLFVFAFSLGVIPWLVVIAIIFGNHNVYLPLAGSTPIMAHAQSGQEITYCLNPRAESYPNFAGQVEDVTDSYRDLGFKLRKVGYGSGCELKHDMTEFNCGGCAAHVYYANWPVLIEYRYVLAYYDWRSAIGHELGHALLGLHERYRDSGGSIGCGGTNEVGLTVMQCGYPHVKYPQPLDVERWCVLDAVSNSVAFKPVCNPEPVIPPCTPWGGRWVGELGAWLYGGTPFFIPPGPWETVPEC